MQSTTCSGCGATLTPGAQFCAYCGTAVAATTPAPLALGGSAPPLAPSPAPPTWAPTSPPPPRRRASRVLLIIVVFLVVVILVGVVALAFFVPSAPSYPIMVGALFIYSPDNACGLASNPSYYPSGFNSSLGANVSLPLYLPNFNTTSCTIHGLTTNTTGFTIVTSSIMLNGGALPGTIAGSPSTSNPTTATLVFTIETPASAYSGNVSLVFR